MPRRVTSGTPDRSASYLFPSRRVRPLWWSLGAAGFLATLILALYAIGQRRFTSPGPVSRAHAPVEFQCAQCHSVGRGVEDLRCERCHDARGVDLYTHQAHVLFGSGSATKAAAGRAMSCITCHTEHRGRQIIVKAVDDRECGTCHRNPDTNRTLSSFSRHPEFAAVLAGVESGSGLNFGHLKHLDATEKRFGKRCDACHELTSDKTAFLSINFDRHCSTCHEHQQDGVIPGDSDSVSTEYLSMAFNGITVDECRPVPTNSQAAGPCIRPGDTTGSVIVTRMKHRDPWVLYNLERLRRMADPFGFNAERVALRSQMAYLREVTQPPLSQLNSADLRTLALTLPQEIVSLNTRLAAGSSGTDDAALHEIRDAVRSVAKQLGPLDGQMAADIDGGPDSISKARQTESTAARLQMFNARKQELAGLLDAIGKRGNPKLSARVEELRRRMDGLQPKTPGDADTRPLNDRLRSLDEILGIVRSTGDYQAIASSAEVAALRDVAALQVGGGIARDEFEDRRRELLSALDAIDRNGPIFASRTTPLRQRVLRLQPGGYDNVQGLRNRKMKLLERVKLELSLVDSRSASLGPSATASSEELARLSAGLSQLGTRLAELQQIPPVGSADTPSEIRKVKVALANLIVPCLTCHRMDLPVDADGVPLGTRLAPMRPASTVFQRARFTHKPHVEQISKCESCHTTVGKSQKATDVNEPGVAKCQECHVGAQARSDCAACHYYHPPSIIRLLDAI